MNRRALRLLRLACVIGAVLVALRPRVVRAERGAL